jgi:hypothetical protein
MKKNLRIRSDERGRCLRLTFQASNRTEQATILNALLRIYMQLEARMLKNAEDPLQRMEEGVPRLEELVKTERDPVLLDRWRKDLLSLPSDIAKLRAEVARRKQIAVIKWAK